MDKHDFIARYGGVYEHSPWVAEQVAELASGLDDPSQLADLMADCVDNASREQQLVLIRAHPDLAGKAQVAGELTEDSTAEQSSAGLNIGTWISPLTERMKNLPDRIGGDSRRF